MPIRVGVIGVGHGRAWLDAFSRIDDVKIEALAALSKDTRRSDAAAKFGVEREFDSHKDLLAAYAQHPLDIVAVAVPPKEHVRVVLDSLEAGSHTLCEKPPTTSAESAQRCFFRALAKERVLFWALCFRYARNLPPVRTQVEHTHVSWKRSTKNGADWAERHDVSGGGALIDLGIHGIDLALHLWGYPTPIRVYAEAYNEHGKKTTGPIDSRMIGHIDLPHDKTLSFDVDWASNREEQRLSFTGTGVSNAVDLVSDDDIFWRTASACISLIYSAHPAEQFSLTAQGVVLMKTIDALYKSARTGQPVAIS